LQGDTKGQECQLGLPSSFPSVVGTWWDEHDWGRTWSTTGNAGGGVGGWIWIRPEPSESLYSVYGSDRKNRRGWHGTGMGRYGPDPKDGFWAREGGDGDCGPIVRPTSRCHPQHQPHPSVGPGVKTKVEPAGGARRQPERRRGRRQLPAYRAPNPSASLAGCRKKNLAESETERRALPIRRRCCAHSVTRDKYPSTVSSSSSLGGCV
jgi:hypothetical protein